MSINFQYSGWGKSLLIFTMSFGTMWFTFCYKEVEAQNNAANEVAVQTADKILLCGKKFSRADFMGATECLQGDDDCLPAAAEDDLPEAINRIKVVLTAYSSTIAQTDSTPFITANGTYVHDGIVANNGLPFGTEIRIPDIYGDKVFSVEDRMHWSKGSYQFDIWFPTYEQAKNFGVKYAYVEILDNN